MILHNIIIGVTLSLFMQYSTIIEFVNYVLEKIDIH